MDNSTFFPIEISMQSTDAVLASNRSSEVQHVMKIVQNMANVNVVVLMFSLGCDASFQDIKNYFKNPKQFIFATLLQLLGMPCFAMANLFNLTTAATLGVIIMTIAPGGSYSNVVTYWMDGDISLSVTMTSCSTILSLGTMPMWLFIFTWILNVDAEFQIPFATIFIALTFATVPVGIAFLYKYKFPNAATKTAKYGSFVGSILILATLIILFYFGLISSPSGGLLAINFIVPIGAVVVGYFASIIPCLKFGIAARRTIAIETAFQNAPIALSVALLSFGDADIETVMTVSMFTMIYGTTMICASACVIIIYQVLKGIGIKWVQPTQAIVTTDTKDDSDHDSNELEPLGKSDV